MNIDIYNKLDESPKILMSEKASSKRLQTV